MADAVHIPTPCEHDQCGRPQQGQGRPRTGWIQLKRAGENAALWFCSFHCTSRYAIRRELRGSS